jgi:hypothetical protein
MVHSHSVYLSQAVKTDSRNDRYNLQIEDPSNDDRKTQVCARHITFGVYSKPYLVLYEVHLETHAW